VPFSGVKLGAGLGERGGRLDGAAARRLGEAHRLQHQRQRPRDGGERLAERRRLVVLERA